MLTFNNAVGIKKVTDDTFQMKKIKLWEIRNPPYNFHLFKLN